MKKGTKQHSSLVVDFYVTVPSDGGGQEFSPTNSNTRFKIRLPNRILLKEGEWEVAMVSMSFPIRDHHKHYMLSRFSRGTIVAKIEAQASFHSKKWGATSFGVSANIRIEDFTDPNTKTDVNPIKDGLSFARHLVFALQKGIHRAAVKAIKEDNDLTGGWFGEEDRT